MKLKFFKCPVCHKRAPKYRVIIYNPTLNPQFTSCFNCFSEINLKEYIKLRWYDLGFFIYLIIMTIGACGYLYWFVTQHLQIIIR